MTIYKGLVKDRETKQYEVVTGEYTSKKAFMEDIRRNGLSVNPSRVKTVAVYDAIIKYTDGSELAWRLCKTVEDAKNWNETLEKYLDSKLEDIQAAEQTEDKKEYTLFINDNFTFTVYERTGEQQLSQVISCGTQRLENLVEWFDDNVKCYLESYHKFIDIDLFKPLIWYYNTVASDSEKFEIKELFKNNVYAALNKYTELYQAYFIKAGADLVREEMI